MISAPYPEAYANTESVGEYNRKHWAKAWEIVALTWQGEIYCAECVEDWPTYEHDLTESPTPVFSSDEYEGMVCGKCCTYIH